jgi:hypothetical protein
MAPGLHLFEYLDAPQRGSIRSECRTRFKNLGGGSYSRPGDEGGSLGTLRGEGHPAGLFSYTRAPPIRDFDARACSNYAQCLDDQRKVNECEKESLQFFESGKDAPNTLESPEKSYDLVAFLVKFAIVLPGIEPVGFGWHRRNRAQIVFVLWLRWGALYL